MKLKIRLGIIISLFAVLSGPLLACSSSQAATVPPPTPKTTSTASPSEFKVSNLALNPAEVNAGVQILMAAKVTNTGIIDENYQANIRIDNTTQKSLPSFLSSDEVKIPAGQTQLLSVITTINNPGTYKVTWDDVSQTLLVNPEETSAPGNSQNAAPIAAPDFTAVDVVTGKTVSLNQYKGSTSF